jgi:hypothetical protein
MDPLNYLSMRFHYRGTFEFIGKDWIYKGEKQGLSIVLLSKLSISELKKHLSHHVSCSEEVMEMTELCWKIHVGPMQAGLVMLTDKKSVLTMANYNTDDGVMDLYANIRLDIAPADSDGENVDAAAVHNSLHVQNENASMEHDLQQEPAIEQQGRTSRPTINGG